MLQLDDLSRHGWQNIHARVDRGIADAALTYLRRLHIRRIDGRVTGAPQIWSEELDELTMQREPAYNMPGVPLIYALRYMIRRVTSIVGALARVSGARYATSVLDVGSGTGATTVALDLMNMPRHISLVGVEPNTEMTEFAEYLRLTRVSARYLPRPLADLAELQRSLDRVHLVVFSATFPYGFDDWSALADALGNYEEHEDKLILAIEPDAKSGLLDEFQIVLRKRGWPTARFCCHELPDLMKQDLPCLSSQTCGGGWARRVRHRGPGGALPTTDF